MTTAISASSRRDAWRRDVEIDELSRGEPPRVLDAVGSPDVLPVVPQALRGGEPLQCRARRRLGERFGPRGRAARSRATRALGERELDVLLIEAQRQARSHRNALG